MEPAGDGEARRGALRKQPTSGRSLRDGAELRRATERQRRRPCLQRQGVDGVASADRGDGI